MARSLTVNHQEVPSTNRLLNAFLLLAIGVMLAQTVTAFAVARSSAAAPVPVDSVDHP